MIIKSKIMKKLLIVVDYQNDFVDGALGFPKAKEIEPYIVSLIEQYKKQNKIMKTCQLSILNCQLKNI